jgi:hypothetical protein
MRTIPAFRKERAPRGKEADMADRKERDASLTNLARAAARFRWIGRALSLAVLSFLVASHVGAADAPRTEDDKDARGPHRFTFVAPAVGRTAEQEVAFTLQLKATTVQAGRTIDEVESKIARRQARSTTVLATKDGRITKVRVAYRTASQEASGQRRGEPAAPPATADQAVAGKTYLVARENESDPLSITDEQGKTPPDEERQIVANNMDAIGRPSALGKFLNGRTIRVSQSVEVPSDVANQLLGFDDAVGKVTKFEMTLARVAPCGGVSCGEFETNIQLKSADAAGHATHFRGRMVVEVATCRGVESEFAGPVSFVENHGTAGAGFQVFSVGALKVRTASSSPARVADRGAGARR